MATTADERVKQFLLKEDAVIAAIESSIADLLEGVMDQMLQDFERNQQLGGVSRASGDMLADSLTAGWSAGIALGLTEYEMLERKQQDELTPRVVLRYLQTYGVQRVRQISSTTVNQLGKIITDGQRQGKNPAEITRLLLDRVPKLARQRAKIIATTEVHSASQFGLIEAARATRKPLTKVWQTVEDDRVRSFAGNSAYSHRAMQNTRTPLDGQFRVPHISGTTEPLAFPGDPAGSAGNIVNCRCTMTFEEK